MRSSTAPPTWRARRFGTSASQSSFGQAANLICRAGPLCSGVTPMLEVVQAAPDMLAALQLAAIQMQMGMAAAPTGMGGSGLGGSNGAGRRPPPTNSQQGGT